MNWWFMTGTCKLNKAFSEVNFCKERCDKNSSADLVKKIAICLGENLAWTVTYEILGPHLENTLCHRHDDC